MASFYHVTKSSKVEQIQNQGLRPRAQHQESTVWEHDHVHDDVIYLFADRFGAAMYAQDVAAKENVDVTILVISPLFVDAEKLVVDHEEFADQLMNAYWTPEESIISDYEAVDPGFASELTGILDAYQEAGEPSNYYEFFNQWLHDLSENAKKLLLSDALLATGSAARVMYRGQVPGAAAQILVDRIKPGEVVDFEAIESIGRQTGIDLS